AGAGLSGMPYVTARNIVNVLHDLSPRSTYFPLVVVFCQKYAKRTGIGTLVSIMLPYSVVFIASWTLLLIAYWVLGVPLGLQASYTYP
ncbi:MAG: AbgT family transporter, partial [Planctomycetes bacterium]|nr:AbgT family transporter [Planctomycetota bacterium]